MIESSARLSNGPVPSGDSADSPAWLWIGPRHASLSWPLELLQHAADGEVYGLLDASDLSRQSIESMQMVSQRLWPTTSDRFEWEVIPRQRITRLIISSEERSEPWPDWLSAALPWFPQAKPLVLLGSWWEGHRRTESNLPDIPWLYWHQAFDRLGAWLIGGDRDHRPRACGSLVLVLSPAGRLSSERVSLWHDLLASYDLQPMVLEGPASLPSGSPMSVLVDHSEAGELSAAVAERCWLQLRQTYPDSWLISCRAFPRWDQWLADRRAGADRLLSQPFDAEGLNGALGRLGAGPRTGIATV